MDGHPFISLALQLLGGALVLLSITDVFMTVLYARVGTGPLSHRIGSGLWCVFRRIGRLLPCRRRQTFLSYCGPVLLASLLCVWLGLLLAGFTLIAWPGLGRGIASQSGPTSTDLMTAFYYAGGSLTTVGSGDLRPISEFFRFLTVIDSIIGMLVLTLSVTYIIQIYSALHARNALAMTIHHASAGSADAAEMLASLGAGDNFERGVGLLEQLAAEVTAVYEAHHFYSALIYFRFPEPSYALARGALVTMELLTLADAALDPARHGWLPRSAAAVQLREATMHVLSEFARAYLPDGPPEHPDDLPDPATVQRWRRRYRAAGELLRAQGISLTREQEHAEARYVDLRRHWDTRVFAFAHYMEFEPQEIDPAGCRPAETGNHRELETPELRAAG